MNTCIKNGWITWHAFPHVAELEIMDESCMQPPLTTRSSIQFGIQMSNDLKRRFNKPDSRFISQNDVRPAPLAHPQVPGTTAAAIPILKKLGIEAFHILVFALARLLHRTPGRERGQPAPQRPQHLSLAGPGERRDDPQPEPPQRLRRLADVRRGELYVC